jgi:hypothetical protein
MGKSWLAWGAQNQLKKTQQQQQQKATREK